MGEKILRNAVKCKGCGKVIESKHRHDFVTCQCGDVSVDGGHSYFRRAFTEGAEWDDLSETEAA